MRSAWLPPPIARIIVPGPDGRPEVADEILQFLTAPPGWAILCSRLVDKDDTVEDLLTDPILGWAVGRNKSWPFTSELSAEALARDSHAVVRPDGAVIDENGQYFGSLESWLLEAKAELQRRRAA